jgi:hypothetical protein
VKEEESSKSRRAKRENSEEDLKNLMDHKQAGEEITNDQKHFIFKLIYTKTKSLPEQTIGMKELWGFVKEENKAKKKTLVTSLSQLKTVIETLERDNQVMLSTEDDTIALI